MRAHQTSAKSVILPSSVHATSASAIKFQCFIHTGTFLELRKKAGFFLQSGHRLMSLTNFFRLIRANSSSSKSGGKYYAQKLSFFVEKFCARDVHACTPKCASLKNPTTEPHLGTSVVSIGLDAKKL